MIITGGSGGPGNTPGGVAVPPSGSGMSPGGGNNTSGAGGVSLGAGITGGPVQSTVIVSPSSGMAPQIAGPRTPAEYTGPYQHQLASLMDMGFSMESSRQALEATEGDMETAANLLLSQSD